MSAVRIASVEAIPIALPFARPYMTATGRLDRREMVVVKLTAEDGTVGWGDAVPMSLRGGPSAAAVHADIEGICASILTGAEADPAMIAATLGRCGEAGAGRQALCGVDVALLDLAGKLAGEPVWRLLGAAAAAPVACNATIGADDPDSAATSAAAAARAGFGAIKVKVGDGDEGDRLAAVRSAVGSAVHLRIDANGAWTSAEALRRLEDLGAIGLELAEQPCPGVAELAAVREATSVPIVADESVASVDEAAEAVAIGAIDAATLKLAKVGGPHAALAIDAVAPAYLSSALDSVIGIAAAAHTAQAMARRDFASGLAHGLATSQLFADNVCDDGPFSGPAIDVGQRPGLGIEVDETAIERLRLT